MPQKDPEARRKWRREYRRKWLSNRDRTGKGTRLQALRATRPCPDTCEVCGAVQSRGTGRRLDFDHCHEANVFRGWLCNPCNLALGNVKDDPERLRKLADYVENFNLLQ